MIKVILFDLGGVLFTNGTRIVAKYIAEKHHKNVDDVYNLFNYSDIGNAYREGKIARDEFWDQFKENLKIKDSTDELEQKWNDFYEIIEETKEILDELRKEYKVYFLSDQIKERAVATDKKYGFIKWFHGGIFSHEVGVRKPNIEIYKLALKKVGARAEEVLFIDDKEINLPPAEKVGMKILLYSSPDHLREELGRRGILK